MWHCHIGVAVISGCGIGGGQSWTIMRGCQWQWVVVGSGQCRLWWWLRNKLCKQPSTCVQCAECAERPGHIEYLFGLSCKGPCGSMVDCANIMVSPVCEVESSILDHALIYI